MDNNELEQMVQKYLGQAIAPSTLRTYKSGKARFSHFCEEYNYPLLPVSEDILCKYVAFIANQGLKHATIKTYLSAIRHMQIVSGYGDPFKGQMARLEYVMRGVKYAEAKTGRGNTRTSYYSSVVESHESWPDERSS